MATIDYAPPDPRRDRRRVARRVAVQLVLGAAVLLAPWAYRAADAWLLQRRIERWRGMTRAVPVVTTADLTAADRDDVRRWWAELTAALNEPLGEWREAVGRDRPPLTVEVSATFELAHRLADDLAARQHELGGGPLPSLMSAAEAAALYGPMIDMPGEPTGMPGHGIPRLLEHAGAAVPVEDLAAMRDALLAEPVGTIESDVAISFAGLASGRVAEAEARDVLLAVLHRDANAGGGRALSRIVAAWVERRAWEGSPGVAAVLRRMNAEPGRGEPLAGVLTEAEAAGLDLGERGQVAPADGRRMEESP